MIVSHQHRFIFIKTKKTGSTSVEIALSRHCGEDDIIGPIIAEDEAMRLELGYRGAQNCDIPYSAYGPRELWHALKRGHRLRYRSHSRADWLRRRVPRKAATGPAGFR